jgi:hypothetical protein
MTNIIKKDVKYINKDFGQFRQNLINFTKNYFPNTYNDFNETSPGMMFIEMASYVGDVLSFYTDTQHKESLLTSAEETINLYNLAHAIGYKPKLRTAAIADIDVFQLLPAIDTGQNTQPDFKYSLIVPAGTVVSTNEGISFRTLDTVDFSFSSSYDATDISIYQLDETGQITFYLAKKQVQVIAGEIQAAEFEFETPKPYDKIVIDIDEPVLDIIDVKDSDGNIWYEVPYLSQDLVPVSIPNIPYYDEELSKQRGAAPYILKYVKTEKRFVTRLRSDNKTELQFGSGISSDADEEIIPNPTSVGSGLTYLERTTDLSIDPSNFLYTKTYGQAPSGTTLTVRYTIGGGIASNVPATTIVVINSTEDITVLDNTGLDPNLLSLVKNSIAINNVEPATGGSERTDIEAIRIDAMSNFAAQNRAVTKEDYIIRCFTMPSKFGAVAKAYITQDDQLSNPNSEDRIANPFALNLYTLGYDSNKNFTTLSHAVKENLKTYLSQYRMLTDAVNIKDAFIINIGINFEIVIRPNYNANEVILRCVEFLKTKFNNERMQINEPLVLSSIATDLDKIEGVQTVLDVEIVNLYDTDAGYSGNFYNINGAVKNKILYPSLDPCIFEIKYPNKDIKGRVVNI